MRKIVFRGKTVDGGAWIRGHFVEMEGLPCIFNNGMAVRVVPDTVGQFTGLYDRNGKEIFEGDIVNAKVIENRMSGTRKYTDVYEVAYHPKFCYFYLKKEGNNLLFDGNWSYGVTIEEVIGVINDNPELIER